MQKPIYILLLLIFIVSLNIFGEDMANNGLSTNFLDLVQKIICYYRPFYILDQLSYEDEYIKQIFYCRTEFSNNFISENIDLLEKIILIQAKKEKKEQNFNVKLLIEFLDKKNNCILSISLGRDKYIKINNKYFQLDAFEYNYFLDFIPSIYLLDFRSLLDIINRNKDYNGVEKPLM